MRNGTTKFYFAIYIYIYIYSCLLFWKIKTLHRKTFDCHCFKPRFLTDYQSSCLKLFNRVLEKLISSHHLTTSQADNAKAQYSSFLQAIVTKNHGLLSRLQSSWKLLGRILFALSWKLLTLLSANWNHKICDGFIAWAINCWKRINYQQKSFCWDCSQENCSVLNDIGDYVKSNG